MHSLFLPRVPIVLDYALERSPAIYPELSVRVLHLIYISTSLITLDPRINVLHKKKTEVEPSTTQH